MCKLKSIALGLYRWCEGCDGCDNGMDGNVQGRVAMSCYKQPRWMRLILILPFILFVN